MLVVSDAIQVAPAMPKVAAAAIVAAEKTFRTVAGFGGVSSGPSELEGTYATNWVRNIWTDPVG